jgi:hypothetical protein
MRSPWKPLLALLLVLILPMRGFAAAAHCDAPELDRGVHLSQTAGSDTHCAGQHAAGHSHPCGDCCSVTAVVAAPLRLAVPRVPAAELAQRLAWLHPSLTVDRLDRPPRLPL